MVSESSTRNMDPKAVAKHLGIGINKASALMRLGAEHGGIASSDITLSASGKCRRLRTSIKDIEEWLESRSVQAHGRTGRRRKRSSKPASLLSRLRESS